MSSQKGLSISHANGVVAYNTLDRKTSWGQINNLIVKPLFAEDKMSRQVAASTAAAKADAGDKLAHEVIELVQELGSASSETSDGAQRKLGRIARTLGNQLEGASKSSNPQVAYRAQTVLDEFRAPKWPEAEVHMVCLYGSRGRKVVVEVQQTKKPVILIVCAYEGVVWDIQVSPVGEVLQVIASGYHRQRVEGVSVPVATYSYDENSCFYFYTHSETMPTDTNIHARVRELTGKEIASYQGRYYEGQPFVIKSEQ